MAHRVPRVEEALREAIADIVSNDLTDPNLPDSLTVTSIRISSDLGDARVMFTQSPEDPDSIQQTMEILQRAQGFIRNQISEAIQLRMPPRLTFHYDKARRQEERIEELLAEEKRKGAKFRGNEEEE